MISDRRRQPRFLPVENSFAALGASFSKVGKIKDIGLGGLGFEYIVGEASNNDQTRIDIFLSRNAFHLANLPCRVVYEKNIHVPPVSNRHVKALTTKRCGVKFGAVNEEDLAQLKLFLKLRTTGKA